MEEDNILDENSRILTLRDENGDEVEFDFLALIEHNDEEYVILLPVEQDENSDEEGEVVILQREDVDSDDEEFESYISVEDEKTLNEVFEKFKEQFKDDFDFVD